MEDSELLSFFQKDFPLHPSSYDSRSVCHLLWTTSVTSEDVIIP